MYSPPAPSLPVERGIEQKTAGIILKAILLHPSLFYREGPGVSTRKITYLCTAF